MDTLKGKTCVYIAETRRSWSSRFKQDSQEGPNRFSLKFNTHDRYCIQLILSCNTTTANPSNIPYFALCYLNAGHFLSYLRPKLSLLSYNPGLLTWSFLPFMSNRYSALPRTHVLQAEILCNESEILVMREKRRKQGFLWFFNLWI